MMTHNHDSFIIFILLLFRPHPIVECQLSNDQSRDLLHWYYTSTIINVVILTQ